MMRVVLFLLMFSVAAWAGDKNVTGKPKTKSESEHRLSKEEVAAELKGAVFIKETVMAFPGPEKVLTLTMWQFEMKATNFPGGSLPFFVPPQPTISQVLGAFLSSLGTTETYISIIKDSQKKSGSDSPPGI